MRRHIGAVNYIGDFCSDAVVLKPYPACEELRRLGPVVWMALHDCCAVTDYDTARTALETTGSCAKCGHTLLVSSKDTRHGLRQSRSPRVTSPTGEQL